MMKGDLAIGSRDALINARARSCTEPLKRTKEGVAMKRAEEMRVRYLVGELDSLRERLQQVLYQAESLVGVFDEIDRLITRADWSARKMPTLHATLPRERER